VGALPGRIIQGIKTPGPTTRLYAGRDRQARRRLPRRSVGGLLEVLDPEQTTRSATLHRAAFDLSNVMFITTANMTIHPRTPEGPDGDHPPVGLHGAREARIARTTVPRQLKEHGITRSRSTSGQDVLRIIEEYTREAGVRTWSGRSGTLPQVHARCRGRERSLPHHRGEPAEVLAQRSSARDERTKDEVGWSGPAWTETAATCCTSRPRHEGQGDADAHRQLGDVMKESAHAALTYVRSARRTSASTPSASADRRAYPRPRGSDPKDGRRRASPWPPPWRRSSRTSRCARPCHDRRSDAAGRVLRSGAQGKDPCRAPRGITDDHPEEEREGLTRSEGYPKDMRFVFAETMDDVLRTALGKRPDAST